MDLKEQRRLASPFQSPTTGDWTTRLAALAERLPLAAVSLLLFASVFAFAATNEHAVLRVHSTPTTAFVRSLVPVLAGLAAALAFLRPWPALVAIVAMTPVWNSAQISLGVGPIQIILTTVFVGALAAGCLLQWLQRRSVASRSRFYQDRSIPGVRRGIAFEVAAGSRSRAAAFFEPSRIIVASTAAFVALAVASTIASADIGTSTNVLLHGILEPIAFGLVLVWLRPSPRGIGALAAAFAVSVGLASLIDLLQAARAYGSLAQIVNHRLLFTEVTYDNVGLFGVILAAVLPMALVVPLVRRDLTLPRWAAALVAAAGLVASVGLFFTISKSAWVATASSLTLLLLLLMHSWWKRIATTLAVLAISAVFIPWPAFLLQSIPPVDTAYKRALIAMVGQSRFDSWNPHTASGHGSMGERYYAIEGGLRMAVDHPILGVGLDQFHHYYIDLGYRPSGALDNLDHAHSVFPEVAAELGIPALAALLALLGGAAWALWRLYRSSRDRLTRTLAAMLVVSLAGWVVAASAYGADIYRPFRDQASDIVAIAVIVGMAFSLTRWSAEHRRL